MPLPVVAPWFQSVAAFATKAIKKYKLRTLKSAAKRVIVVGGGAMVRSVAGLNHNTRKKSAGQVSRLRGHRPVSGAFERFLRNAVHLDP